MPPTFAAVYGLFATARQLFDDPEAEVNFAMLVHAEQEFEWERHPEVGEALTAGGRVADDSERRGIRLLTFETHVSAEAGPVLRSRMVDLIRSAPAASPPG